ncbi:CocE/NonD family hydrolase [Mesorhizobium sp. M0955]|uniref:CocE/NonD family hydrolase n=1 Tax=Mesorhizobium sp. M0955 TaxID=2957033 RepID=UPI0033354CD1
MNYRSVVNNVELAWIPMKDGRRLAARLLLPSDAEQRPVPAILEYTPYRRRDVTRVGDDAKHYWFAANGYGVARVDIAGMGDSEGLIEDEYVKREQDDALEIIAWLASQPWCTGAVGMIGISWGGFNSLQVAARRPPALKAIVTLCSTVDRYANDGHFMGGCLLNDNLDWGGHFLTMGAFPPDPEMVGQDKWRQIWKHRIENMDLFPARWLEHQRRDAFWKHGSVCENYDAINCPVLALGGWYDGYSEAVFRLVENLKGPVKGIVGPWGHKWAQVGVPGPAIGFLQECKRWWDRWLKNEATGVENDPPLRLWLLESEAPKPHFDVRKGRWIGLPSWPTPDVETQTYYLGEGSLVSDRTKSEPTTISSPLTTGFGSGEWCAYALGPVGPELPLDQRQDDSGSMTFDGSVLMEPLAILGRTLVHLRVAVDQEQAQLAVRLSAVLPGGEVERITYGLLNLAHRGSHEHPQPLTPGQFYDITVELNEIAELVPAGSRLRLAISTSYWPLIWPSPAVTTATIDLAESSFDLPVLTSGRGLMEVEFMPPDHAPPAPTTIKQPGTQVRKVNDDLGNKRKTLSVHGSDGTFVLDDTATEFSYTKSKELTIGWSSLEDVRAAVAISCRYRRSDWDARVESEVVMTSDETHFHIEAKVSAFDKDEPFMTREFRQSVPRDNL